MIAYKKQRRKVDPVKQILARLDEKQSKSGLSLYSKKDVHKSAKEEVLPMVHPLNEANSVSSKSSPFFQDLSAARRKAHRRLNAGLQHAIDDSEHKTALYMQAKADRRLNLTFPPVKSQGMTSATNQDRLGYSFSGWSDSPSAGVENLRHNHNMSMNPFGYNRRTLAFQPTSLNYVVEWPETWPLKIMSLGKGAAVPHKKKTKTKPKVNRKVHFEKSPAPSTSSLRESSNTTKQAPTEAVAYDQSKQDLHSMKNPAATGKALPHSPIIEESVDNRETEESPLMGQALGGNVTRNTLDIEARRSSEIPVEYSDTSSLSESAYLDSFHDKLKTTEVPDDTERRQDDSTTRLSSVPPCTPTPVAIKTEGTDVDNEPESGVDEGEVEEEDPQSLLMGIVSQISSEPAADYMKDI